MNICYKNLSNLTKNGKTKYLLLKSLSDTIGGYLKKYILPQAKLSYYSGNLNFHNCQKLFNYMEDIKFFLHTDGKGWKKSVIIDMFSLNITPIIIDDNDHNSSEVNCNQLIFYNQSKIYFSLHLRIVRYFNFCIF